MLVSVESDESRRITPCAATRRARHPALRAVLALLAAGALMAGGASAQDSAPPAGAAPAATPPAAAPPAASAEVKPDAKAKAAPAGETPAPDADATTYSETVVVSAARTEQPLQDAPITVSVIDRSQIEATPAQNMADLLRGVPGLNVIQVSARDIDVTARGSTRTLSNGQLALVDGQPLMSSTAGIALWDHFPIDFDEIKQVEVVHGPASSLWGSSAMSAVLNVRTLSPREQPGGRLSLGGGEIGTRDGSIRWADVENKLSWRISGSYYEQDAWKRKATLPSGQPLPAGFNFPSFGTEQSKVDVRLDWDVDKDHRWSYRAGNTRSSGTIYSPFGATLLDPEQRTYGQVDYTSPHLAARLHFNHWEGEGKNLLDLAPTAFIENTWRGDITGNHVVGTRNYLVYGASVGYVRFGLDAAPDATQRRDQGAYIEDQIALQSKVTLNVGARLDHFDTFGSALSPRVSLVIVPHPHQSLRIAISRAYRAPTILESYLHQDPANLYICDPAQPPFIFSSMARGNLKLRQETLDGFEIAWTADFRRKHTFVASLYRNLSRDTINFFPAQFYSDADPPPGWPAACGPVPVGSPGTELEFAL